MKTTLQILITLCLSLIGNRAWSQTLINELVAPNVGAADLYIGNFQCSDITLADQGVYTFQVPSSNQYDQSLHIAFGLKDYITLFDDGFLEPTLADLPSGGSLDLNLSIQLTKDGTAVPIGLDNGSTVTLSLGQFSANKYQYADYFTIDNLTSGQYTLSVLVASNTSCGTFGSELLNIKTYRTYKSYTDNPTCSGELTPDFDEYVPGTIEFVTSNNRNVRVPLPSGADFTGSEIDLEWVNIERPLMDVSTLPTDLTSEFEAIETSGSYPGLGDQAFTSSTRVTYKASSLPPSHVMPNVFKRGFLAARYRSADYLPNGKRVVSPWLYVQASNILKIDDSFQEDVIWQSQSSYSEEAKQKDVVSYYDGSQRSRQTVSRIESAKKAIVGETYYDFQGRPSISPMPSPDLSSNTGLGLRPDFNRFDGNVRIRPDKFDLKTKNPGVNVLEGAQVLDDSYGAGLYYSAGNGVEDFVPHSAYAYSKTLYLNDGTNRPTEVSTPGEEFRHSETTDRTTKYYYATPFQTELDRLFGSNAGEASKYKKNFTQDANGQLSVTYLNMAGKVVASALKQDSPDNLDALPVTPETITIHMLNGDLGDKEIQEIDDKSIAFSQTFTSSEIAYYDFSYQILPEDGVASSSPIQYCTEEGSVSLPFGQEDYHNFDAQGQPQYTSDLKEENFTTYVPEAVLLDEGINTSEIVNGCTDCKYNLYIGLIDPEGYVQECYLGASADLGTDPVELFQMSSDEINDATNTFYANLGLGTYTLVKVLSLDEGKLEFKNRVNRVLLNLKPEVAYEEPEYYSEDCIGYYKYMVRLQDTDNDGDPDTRFDEDGNVLPESEVNAYILEHCSEAQDEENTSNPCTANVRLLLTDLSPGGQYFDNLPDQEIYVNGVLQENEDYDKNGWLNAGIHASHQMSSNGNEISNSTSPTPSTLFDFLKDDVFIGDFETDEWYFEMNSWDDLRVNWREEYAAILIHLHPEFIHLLYTCSETAVEKIDEYIITLNNHGIAYTGYGKGVAPAIDLEEIGQVGPINIHITDGMMASTKALDDHLPENPTNTAWLTAFSAATEANTNLENSGYYNPLGIDGVSLNLLPSGYYGTNLALRPGIDPYFLTFSGNNLSIKNKVIKLMTRFQPKVKVDDINDLATFTDADYYSLYDVVGYNFDIGQLSFVPASISEIAEELDACTGNCEDLIMALFHYPEIGYFDMNGGKFEFFKRMYINYRQFAQYARYKELEDDTYNHYGGYYRKMFSDGELDDTEGYSFGWDVGYSRQYMSDFEEDGKSGYFLKFNGTNIDHSPSGKWPAVELFNEDLCTVQYDGTFPDGIEGSTTTKNQYVINIDGSISYYDRCGGFSVAPNGYINTPYGNLYNNPDENEVLKRHDGFDIRFPQNELYEAMEDASNSAEIQSSLLEGSYSNQAVDLTDYCVENATLWAQYLIADDDHDDGNVTQDLPSNLNWIHLHDFMLQFCTTQQGAYFSNNELQTELDNDADLDLTYTINAPNVYELFTYQQPTGSVNTEYIEGYNNHVNRLEDLDCACNTFKSDLYNYDQTPLTISVGSSKINELVDYYLEEGYLDLTNPADIADFKSTLLDWVPVCSKSVRWPVDFYNIAIEGSPTYTPEQLDIPFEELLVNSGGSLVKDKVYTYYSCNEYESNDPQVQLIRQVNQQLKEVSLAEYFALQDLKHLPYKHEYTETCLNIQEALNFSFDLKEYQYTLYYYDAAGNLIKTVPPKGVATLNSTQVANVQAYRKDLTTGALVYPVHTYETTYSYNSLNKLKTQTTPDGGTTEFWYDQLGRVILVQDARQNALGRYSYTVYDNLGRIKESGEVVSPPPTDANLVTIYSGSSNPFITWLGTKVKRDITKTYYDEPVAQEWIQEKVGEQENLRGRISWVSHTDYEAPTSPSNPMYGSVPNHKFTTYTYYSYDSHGNVKRLVQRFKHYAFGDDFKAIEYEYDLISGNVLKVKYQENKNDQFYHKYAYDADNRLIDVYTSYDGLVWKQDANYEYYLHGKLKREELGAAQVQGVDYAYTLNGLLKGVNGNRLQVEDMGNDGVSGQPHASFGQDEFAFALSYFDGDYETTTSAFDNTIADNVSSTNIKPLYGGNISQMYTGIDFENGNEKHVLYNYKYDQLNRITYMEGFENTYLGTAEYVNNYAYDKNGNIHQLDRFIDGGISIDELQYHYYDGTNKLKFVDDSPENDIPESYVLNPSINPTSTPLPTVYDYDASGNLIQDVNDEIESIQWTATGKVKMITKSSTCTGHCDDLEFVYDSQGNRVLKIIKTNGQDASEWKYTYYTYDALENPLATYSWTFEGGVSLITKEINHFNLYGSDRIGIAEKEEAFVESQSFNGSATTSGWVTGVLSDDGSVMDEEPDVIDVVFSSGLVQRLAEPNQNHLRLIGGTSLTMQFEQAPKNPVRLKTITPLKIAERSVSQISTPFTPLVLSNGYYQIESNTVVNLTPSGASIDFNGGISTGFNVLDFMDDFSSNYTNVVVLTPYPTPIEVNFIDYIATDGEVESHQDALAIGYKSFELKNHLGNVLAVMSDAKENNQEAIMLSASDYYPFGMSVSQRSFETDEYYYGFNGMEKDDEIKGDKNSYSTHFRHYNPVLGKWLSLDPELRKFPGKSPYMAFSNNPIIYVDPRGDTDYYNVEGKKIGTDGLKNNQHIIVLDKSTASSIERTSVEKWSKFIKDGENTMNAKLMAMDKVVIAPTPDEVKHMKKAYRLTDKTKNEHALLIGEEKNGTPKYYMREGDKTTVGNKEDYVDLISEGGTPLVDYHTHFDDIRKEDGKYVYNTNNPSIEKNRDDGSDLEFYKGAKKSYKLERPAGVLGYTAPTIEQDVDGNVTGVIRGEREVNYYNETGSIGKVKFDAIKKVSKNYKKE